MSQLIRSQNDWVQVLAHGRRNLPYLKIQFKAIQMDALGHNLSHSAVLISILRRLWYSSTRYSELLYAQPRQFLRAKAATVQARISKSSPSAAWKTLVSGTVKLFHQFEGGHPERGR